MPEIIEEKDGRVATITLNRPEVRNAITRDMFFELLDILNRLWLDRDVGCVVLTGAGDAFSAGGDVKAMVARASGGEEFDFDKQAEGLRAIMECSRLIHEMPKPVIASLPGPAAGAALAMALACDIRLAAEDIKITTAFANVGLSGDFGGSWFLTKMVGTAKARELYYLAAVITSQEAEKLGIINKTVPKEKLGEETAMWAKHIAGGPSVALGYMKRNMNLSEHAPLSSLLDQEALYMTRSFYTDDHVEAAKAFVEKRKPNFKGS
ncbi:MAG: enoyl-CoA hydratase [Pseudomonadota bacterium]